ncbi:MAG: hypothetical protein HWD61_14410 [Parachlamydiaceae bacterium]|nr:MAG: hypothetical protein HWD61_14410 [Parachlamydiaceae bacterium]
MFLPIAPKTQETSAVADDSAKRQETSRESATSQANEEESLSQEPLDQKSKEEESITHLKTDEKVKDKHTTLNEIALAFARADHETQIDETSYLNLIKYQILGGWEFNDNPLYCIDEVKFEGTPSALKAYELFTSPEELEKCTQIKSLQMKQRKSF